MEVDLFISHSSADAEAARALRADLEAAGYSCYLAPDDVVGTEPWAEQILGAIGSSRAMLVLLSAAALHSRHVAREVELANSRGRTVIPIRLEPVTPGGSLEYHLTGMQRIDAFPPPIGTHRDRILRRLAVIFGGQLAATAVHSNPPAMPTVASTVTATSVVAGQTRRRRGARALGGWARSRSSLAGTFVVVAVVLSLGTGMMVFRPASGTSESLSPSATIGAVADTPAPTPTEPGLTLSPSPSAEPSPSPAPSPKPTPTPTPRPTRTPKPPTITPKPPPPPTPTPTPVPVTKPAKITSHTNGATISGGSVTFAWSAATGATSVRYYSIYVGSNSPAEPCPSGTYCREPGDDAWALSDIAYAGGMLPSQRSVQLNGLPADGSTIYVRLFTKYNPDSGILAWRDYTFTSAP
jgi:hypothetical protein